MNTLWAIGVRLWALGVDTPFRELRQSHTYDSLEEAKEDIRKVGRIREPGDEGIMVDCLWADPMDINGRMPSKRGISMMFGPDIT